MKEIQQSEEWQDEEVNLDGVVMGGFEDAIFELRFE